MWKATSCCRIPSLAMWMQSAIETLRPWRKSGLREFPRIARYHPRGSREPRTHGLKVGDTMASARDEFSPIFADSRSIERAPLVSHGSLDK